MSSLKQRVDAALGKAECDLIIKNARVLDVFRARWDTFDIAIADGLIVGLESGRSALRVIDAKGKWVVPGFIDAHVHVESSTMIPRHFEKAVLSKGTTTAICDPHELTNVIGIPGLKYFLDSAEKMQMSLWVMLSSCVPATHLETNGGGTISAEQLWSLSSHPRSLGLAEMMNVPGVLTGDPATHAKLEAFSEHIIDGHCPLLTGKELSAYAAAGISSCHESSQLEEAKEKLTRGISVWIREGSAAKDLDSLIPLLDLGSSTSIGFCTDDRNPLDIATEGHIDFLLKKAMRHGIAPEIVYRSASWSVARHYGLNRGRNRVGAVAPGYSADLVLLEDLENCGITEVFKRGQRVGDLPMSEELGDSDLASRTVRAFVPEVSDLEAPTGLVHVIGVTEGKILTEHRVLPSGSEGVARLSVLERYGKGSKPANGYVQGFGSRFRGAIASSVGHDSHNLIVVGDRASDMRVALQALIESDGGFCVVQDQRVWSHLPLPIGGLMSRLDPQSLAKKILELKNASRSIGCELSEPFLQLAFLSLPVIPSLKLTDQGLVDVEKFQFIDVRAS